jgi:hypothetical protein
MLDFVEVSMAIEDSVWNKAREFPLKEFLIVVPQLPRYFHGPLDRLTGVRGMLCFSRALRL